MNPRERREHDVFEKLVTMIPILGTVDNTEAVDIGAQVKLPALVHGLSPIHSVVGSERGFRRSR